MHHLSILARSWLDGWFKVEAFPIHDVWFGPMDGEGTLGLQILRWIGWISTAVLVFLGAVLTWFRTLRKEVRHHLEALARATSTVRENEQFLARILETLPLAMFGKDPNNQFRHVLWNPKAEELFGLAQAQVMDKTDYDVFPESQADEYWATDLETLNRGGIVDVPEEGMACGASGVLWMHTRKTLILDGEGKPRLILGVTEDITGRKDMETERRNHEAAVRQAQKLESLGVLAGGIAHDFNNLLSAIGGNLELAQMNLEPQSEARPFIIRIEKILKRASDLTHQMLAYSGRGHMAIKHLNLNQVAEEMPHLLEVSISKRVRLEYRLAPDLPLIEADGAQLQQVFMNLVTNASEAIGDRNGTITLTTGIQYLDHPQEQVENHGWSLIPGCYVTLEVSDTGCGIDLETRQRLFDPFFTTKFSGRGLGLSAMLGILKGHRAGIRIESQVGKGSSFKIFFPAIQATGEPEPVAPQPVAASKTTGTILVVDDEPDILEATAGLIAALDFKVTQAGDGLEAVNLLKAHPGEFALVLMDLTMPHMDGREALRHMRELDPGLKVILCSGFPESETTGDHSGPEFSGFLQKPYTLQMLKDAIHQSLG